MHLYEKNNDTHTCRVVGTIVPLGRRIASRSEAAIKAASKQATVVKKPKTFWTRVKELCMVNWWQAGFAAWKASSGATQARVGDG